MPPRKGQQTGNSGRKGGAAGKRDRSAPNAQLSGKKIAARGKSAGSNPNVQSPAQSNSSLHSGSGFLSQYHCLICGLGNVFKKRKYHMQVTHQSTFEKHQNDYNGFFVKCYGPAQEGMQNPCQRCNDLFKIWMKVSAAWMKEGAREAWILQNPKLALKYGLT